MNGSDLLFLRETLALAERGRFTCAPNPTVGCLIVKNGQIIGRGYHQRAGQAHAEVNAISDAGGQVAGSTVYVSLEPCSFVGRTPACAATLLDAGVRRVVAAMQDPFPEVAGAGFDMLRRAGIEVENAELPEAHELLKGYLKRVRSGRPYLRLKTASSLDGAVALADGQSQWITGAAARADVQYWRARSDAIVTGSGTVLADNPQLNVRAYEAVQQPLRVVLDRRARIPRNSRVLQDGGATLWMTGMAQEDLAPGVENLVLSDGELSAQLDTLLDSLGARGCNEVLIEAGPALAGSILASGLWDEWLAYLAPKLLGDGAQALAQLTVRDMASTYNAEITDITQLQDDLRLTLLPRTQS